MRTIFLMIAGLMIITGRLAAQVNGQVVNQEKQPIEAATVVMQTPDSTFIDAVITDSLGHFSFRDERTPFRLIFQHILYQSQSHDYTTGEVGVIVMREQDYALDEVVVTGERPLVKVENGALTYDVNAMAKQSAVSNAYESITRLPGVMEQEGSLSLMGAGAVTVILNGKPSSMTNEQLMSLLKNTPVSNVEKAEIMYSAPAKYRVRGAVINIELKKQKSEEAFVRGEIGGDLTQGRYTRGKGNLNLSLVGQKVTTDLLYSADYTKTRTDNDFLSHHTLGDKLYDIEQYNKGTRQKLTHHVRAAVNYQITEKDNLNIAYTTALSPNTKRSEISTGNLSDSYNHKKGNEQMHNLNLDYTARWGMNVGLDYTYYSYPDLQDFSNTSETGTQIFSVNSDQRIHRWNVYAGQSHALPNGWNLNYGINFTFANEQSSQNYRPQDGKDMSALNSNTDLNERTYNFYGGFEKAFNDRLSLSLSIAGEYYKLADYTTWAAYPSMQLSYILSSSHIFQLALSSDKSYPDYWEMQDVTSYLNGYARLIGNPFLRPSTDYTADLTYILRSKYLFNIYYTHVKNKFAQLAYQSPDELTMIYQTINYNYGQNFGATAVIPFLVGKIWNIRLTLDGSYQKDVCNRFHDIRFDNSVWRGIVMMNNTLKISSKPDISLELNGLYVTPSIQGLYDLSAIWKVDAGLKWTFANQNAELRLTGNDLFNSSTPNAKVNDKGQCFEMIQHADNRYVSLSFTYKFGGFKPKEHKEVDTSRFGY